ncbi:lytic transglycosylase domain protein [Citrifermentans bemidjiense Bem]|uniref:Lytic transglycosylase domain protein n=1 Tax=Citrifermentans bemidjiense (strain ATCC BAA-1014 / DSM 16622 / JCM 12645 / Bem) TaxID=404380 RepID=B5EH74_CITBB|nr:transglycosylase SLT domain-containing protein [Citrifermentans bemidjiense]ACH39610.1 lytic transglycosylase domain protein [Citrifermentans bemidjiense Bem]
MFNRTAIAAAAVLFCTALPASALTFKPADEALASAASRMQAKDYRTAKEAASKVNDKGVRSFMVGMAAARLEQWEEAAAQLPAAAEGYPILADYALYYQGLSLAKLERHDQALTPLYRLLKHYPESRLVRAALILYADTLAAAGHYNEAQQSYATFVERYPSGSDSISALYGSALCKEKLGDPIAAAKVLRGIYLNYPASSFSDKSARDLQRLTGAGTKVDPYTSAELFKRCGTLYGLGRYLQAAEAYAEIPLSGESADFVAKLKLKKGQALYKARHYQQAQATFSNISGARHESDLWLARTLDKTGEQDQAFKLYMQLAQDRDSGNAGQEALLEAAYLKRFQRKWSEALPLFKQYLTAVQQKPSNVLWESAWASYQSRNYEDAAAQFKKLTEREDLRDKSLYWLGKTLAATGDAKGAQQALSTLAAEFPLGYYALISNNHAGEELPLPPKSITEALPMPSGFEREKALISLGFYDEAVRELSIGKKNRSAAGIARLYLEMENFNGAFHAMSNEKPKRGDKDNATIWGVAYPLAYKEDVARHAAANAIPESLVYAVMRQESNYFPAALSPVGAVGLMQIMPATAEAMSKGDSKRLTTPELNIRLGTRHLKDLLDSYDRNLTLAIAAYNAGSGNVKRWQKGYGHLPQDEFVESIPFKETREYVKKVVTGMEMYQRLYRLPPYQQPNLQKKVNPASGHPGEQKVAQAISGH